VAEAAGVAADAVAGEAHAVAEAEAAVWVAVVAAAEWAAAEPGLRAEEE
jgi:hypothetical protein